MPSNASPSTDNPTPTLAELESLGETLQQVATRTRHREPVVVAGERQWAMTIAKNLLATTALQEILWVCDSAPAGANVLPVDRTAHLLGRELDGVVYDAYSGFDPDTFGTVAGTIRSGGLLLLITPPLQHWPNYSDPESRRIAVALHPAARLTGRFLRRAARLIRDSHDLTLIEKQGQSCCIRTGHFDLQPTKSDAPSLAPYRTHDQQKAVAAIVKVISGQRRRPVVLTSDRGRGKSASLGLAAAQLMRGSTKRILVTGPGLSAVEPLFLHARQQLDSSQGGRGSLHFGETSLTFHPPDLLLREQPEADLLLVDEAATIPTPLLEKLLETYPRIAFATTVHGYEGTGRGFALRFRQILDRKTRGWKELRMETPVRWAPGDPLERFTFRLLMLDADVATADVLTKLRPQDCAIEQVDRERLADDEKSLRQLFGLLILAHYRTRPYDLRHILDGPNLTIHLLRHGKYIVGVVLAAREGGFDRATTRDIWSGERRPRGHLLPETLAAHLGLLQAPEMRCCRILRIAIHPVIQKQGFGTHLLRAVTEQLGNEPLDYLGTSFGATPDLIRFWQKSGYQPVRLGVKRGATSGAHSALLLRGVSEAGCELTDRSHQRFIRSFLHQLSDPLRNLESEMVLTLLATANTPLPLELDDQDRLDLEAFARGHRIYESVIEPLWKLGCFTLTDPCSRSLLTAEELEIFVRKVVQKLEWELAGRSIENGGRRRVSNLLRTICQKTL